MSRMYEQWTQELEELQTKYDDLGIQRDELKSEIEDLEYEISNLVDGDVVDDTQTDDNNQRAADMNATLADIGSTRL